jgi:hypothetical protein
MEVEKGIRALLAKYRQIQLVLISRDYSSITSTLTLQVPPMRNLSLNSDHVKGLLHTLHKVFFFFHGCLWEIQLEHRWIDYQIKGA